MPASDVTEPPSAGGGGGGGGGGEVAPADDGLDALRPFGIRQIWPAGATLLRQGEHPRLLFVIERGEVALWDESERGRRLVQIVRAGASVGDLPVLLDQRCLYTAIARVETETLGFSRETVHNLLELDPQICFLWLRLLSRRIEPGYPRNVALAGRSAAERVALFLLNESPASGGEIGLTQAEMASATGLSRQGVSRVLRSLERLGVLERGRGRVSVIDSERLRAVLPH